MMTRRRLISLLLTLDGCALLVGACNAPAVRLPVPIFSTPIPTATPTVTPSPTPSPTPTPLPTEVVNQGERDLHNGNWEAAVLAFQQVLADPGASPDAIVAAQIGLAQASLRRGDFASAQASLDTFLAQNPAHPRAAQAYFLRGDAKLGLSDWSGAIADFQTYQTLRPGLLDTYIYERIADAYLPLGQTDLALQSYDQAIATAPSVDQIVPLRQRVATVNRELGKALLAVGQAEEASIRFNAAVAQYQAILEVAQIASYRAEIEYFIGQTWFEAGQYEAAYSQLDHVFLTYPDSYYALEALRALLEVEGYEADQYQRGVVNFNQGQYDIALQAFENYWAANKPSDYRPESYLYVARSYDALGNPAAALTTLQVLISQYGPGDGSAWGDAWLEEASIYAEQGNTADAYSTYEQLVAEHPDLPQAPDALYRAGQLAESVGDTTKATAYYQLLATQYPTDTRAAPGLFGLALTAYRGGDLATAETLFSSAAQLPANERPAASTFWLGKTLLAANRPEEATNDFNAAITTEKDGYYGLRAADLLAGRAPFTPPASVTLPADPEEGRTEAEQWLVARFGLTGTPPLAESLRPDLAGDIRMIRGKELWDLGLMIEAREDFESVRKDSQDDPLATYQLAIYFREIGLYRSSILAAGRLLRLAETGPLEAPVFLARLRYPTYFSDLVIADSTQYTLDPLMVFALIWQESIFEGFATSSASAQGLMQIWPPTGEDIASALAWPDYRPSDLQRPYVNVAFGTWLLRDELDRFDGDIYTTLAAYNAGTGRASDWQAASAGDPDLFVEVISLTEPQTYIRRIYEHYAVYRALYGTQQ